jgi:hypothetical protein
MAIRAAMVAIAVWRAGCAAEPRAITAPAAFAAALGPPPSAVVAAAAPATDAPDAPAAAGVVAADDGLRWLKGSTHVHAAPSGDSSTPIDDVVRWYERRGYDFIVLTDHNRITSIDADTSGQVWSRAPGEGLLVLAGIELTYNPAACDPPPPLLEGRCRIHVNALGVVRRVPGRIEWADRTARARVAMYQRALDTTAALGGLAQLNHPQWHWGMTGALLTELGRRGLSLVEIANRQFDAWDAGGARFPSTEALWDEALGAGVTLWGVASDDAHSYDQPGRYPAGGGWVMVRAPRDPIAIRDALAAGRFYSSTGVALARAGVEHGALLVEVAADSPGDHAISFIGGGRVLAEVSGRAAHYPLAGAPGYVRAVVRRSDGARAWVQPARP